MYLEISWNCYLHQWISWHLLKMKSHREKYVVFQTFRLLCLLLSAFKCKIWNKKKMSKRFANHSDTLTFSIATALQLKASLAPLRKYVTFNIFGILLLLPSDIKYKENEQYCWFHLVRMIASNLILHKQFSSSISMTLNLKKYYRIGFKIPFYIIIQ